MLKITVFTFLAAVCVGLPAGARDLLKITTDQEGLCVSGSPMKWQVEATNPHQQAMNGHLDIFFPTFPEPKTVKLKQTVSVEPGRNAAFDGECRVPQRPGIYLLRAKLLAYPKLNVKEYVVRVVDQKHACPRLAPVTIDGDLSEWEGQESLAINRAEQVATWGWRQATRKGKWNGTKDLSANVFIGWGDGRLYFALDVSDDVLKGPFKDTEKLNEGECVELFIDIRPRLKIASQYHRYYPGVYRILIAPRPGPDGKLTTFVPDEAVYKRGPLPREFVAKVKPGGYTLEGSLELSAKHFPGVEFKEGLLFGFAAEIDDADAQETREAQMMLFETAGGRSWNATSTQHFGLFELK